MLKRLITFFTLFSAYCALFSHRALLASIADNDMELHKTAMSSPYWRKLYLAEHEELARNMHGVWDKFFKNNPYKKPIFLQTCSGDGSFTVRTALMSYSRKRRKQIIVIAITPVCAIDPDLCQSVKYIDEAPLFDKDGKRSWGHTTDYNLQSKKYDFPLRENLSEIILQIE